MRSRCAAVRLAPRPASPCSRGAAAATRRWCPARPESRRSRRPRGGGAALTGAGATFPNPIYTKWFDAYHKADRRPDQLPVDRLRRRHPPVHRGDGGLRRHRRTDEGRADRRGPGQRPAHPHRARRRGRHLQPAAASARRRCASTAPPWPTSSSAGSPSGTTPGIAALNPGVSLPATGHHRGASLGRVGHHLHLHRLPVQGLARVEDARWAARTSVKWPIGLGGKGNEGVTRQVKQTAGRDRLRRARSTPSATSCPTPRCKNAAGQFVEASLKTRRAAARRARSSPDTDFRVSITNAAGRGRVSHLVVHLAPGPEDAAGHAPRAKRSEVPRSGCSSPRPSAWRRISTTRPCRCRSSSCCSTGSGREAPWP